MTNPLPNPIATRLRPQKISEGEPKTTERADLEEFAARRTQRVFAVDTSR
jgi:hypothetical protein